MLNNLIEGIKKLTSKFKIVPAFLRFSRKLKFYGSTVCICLHSRRLVSYLSTGLEEGDSMYPNVSGAPAELTDNSDYGSLENILMYHTSSLESEDSAIAEGDSPSASCSDTKHDTDDAAMASDNPPSAIESAATGSEVNSADGDCNSSDGEFLESRSFSV